jgi:hypothetical protein
MMTSRTERTAREVLATSEITGYLRAAADALMTGDETAADQAMEHIHVERGPQIYSHATPRRAYAAMGKHVPPEASAQVVVVSTKSAPPKPQVKARVMQDGGFVCRYCMTPVLPQKILGVFSALWPEAFPYHTNCRTDASHIAYRTNYAEIDHVNALAGGGDSDEANLVVACLVCNSRKGRGDIDAIGWVTNDPSSLAWDGFVPVYRELLDLAARRYKTRPEVAALVDAQRNPPTIAAHATWLRAFGLSTQ